MDGLSAPGAAARENPGTAPAATNMVDDYVLMAREDFWCFVELVFKVLHPNQKLIYAEYLELIASILMSLKESKRKRLIFNLPPRHMKSLLISVLYPAWRLGQDPTAKFICISYSSELAHAHSFDTRKVMLSPIYRRIFPRTNLEKTAVNELKTTKGGHRFATAVNSTITGFGADIIIIDDPIQPDQAASESVKETLRAWVQSSVVTRFNAPQEGVLMLVMHRLAPDDLSATMEADGSDFTLKLPLIAEKVEHYTSKTRTLMYRCPGDVLNPARFDAEAAAKLKKATPPSVFASQYQQRPTVGGSGMLSLEHFRRYKRASPPVFELIIHSWDIGATILGNASVCTVWGLHKDPAFGDTIYLRGVQRVKMQLPQVRAAIIAADAIDRPCLIILDERGVGLGPYQELRSLGYNHVSRLERTAEPLESEDGPGHRPNVKKVERFGVSMGAICDGRVVLPEEAPWLDPFLYEVSAFPNIRDDDQVDSMTQLVSRLDRAVAVARRHARNRA